MYLDHEHCYRAICEKDRRYDGLFFTAVHSTGIYCRPTCPARKPLSKNVSFLRSSSEALALGFRPCLRCRPECAPGSFTWMDPSGSLARSLRLIADGFLDEGSLDDLARRVEMTPRHLRRLFQKHLGTTPSQLALTQRLETARRLLNESDLSMTDLAFAAGFSSLRSFNDAFQRVYKVAPSSLRRKKLSGNGLRLKLAYRPPYDWDWVSSYLKARALQGVEEVDSYSYSRSHQIEDLRFQVRLEWSEEYVLVILEGGASAGELALGIREVTRRTNRLLDLHLNPRPMVEQLQKDPFLAPHLSGVRLPQGWDRFETAVRTILGQQVSVQAATTLAGRLVEQFGEEGCFPGPCVLAEAAVEKVGLTKQRAATIRDLAKLVALDPSCLDKSSSVESLRSIKGIGPWTCLLYTSPSPRDQRGSRMPSSA